MCFSSETVTGIVADGALDDVDEVLLELLLDCATGLTPVILPLTVLPSGSSTVTGSCSTASLCFVASRSTVTTRSVEDEAKIASALAAPLEAPVELPVSEEEPEPPDDAALDDAEPPPVCALPEPEEEVPVEDRPVVLEPFWADFSSACSSLFWVSRSLTMASKVLPELFGGVVESGVVVVVGVVVVGVVVVGVVVVGVVIAGQSDDGVVAVAGGVGHEGVVATAALAGALSSVAVLEVDRSTNSA